MKTDGFISKISETLRKISKIANPFEKIKVLSQETWKLIKFGFNNIWSILSAYFFVIIVNILVYFILSTGQLKDSYSSYKGDTDWLRWGVLIGSICCFIIANHFTFAAIQKYSFQNSESYRNENKSQNEGIYYFSLLLSIVITIFYFFYINNLISDNGGFTIVSLIVLLLLLWVIIKLFDRTENYVRTSLWHYFHFSGKFRIWSSDKMDIQLKKDLTSKLYIFSVGCVIFALLTLLSGKQMLIKIFLTHSIIFLAFTFLLLFYTEFIVIPKTKSVKVLIPALMLVALFSYFFDSTQPIYLERVEKRENYKQHFTNWVNQRNPKMNDTIPFILIASEGGGIRAMSWTLLSLKHLEQHFPIKNFNNYVYAISGVSGGAVGATFHVSLLKDKLHENNPKINEITSEELILQDYLSDLVRGNFFRTPINSFLPLSALDRNKMLEDSWAGAYEQLTNSKTLDDPFLNLWSKNQKYDLPSLILNGTFAETGQKAIISNIDFSNNGKCQLNDVVDVYSLLKSTDDFSTKTATSLSARFPIVTSGALIKDQNHQKSGHITDGGYHDNTGLETCIQVLNLLMPKFKEAKAKGVTIKPYIFFLKNGLNIDETQKVNADRLLPEVSTILGSFYNSWDIEAEIKYNMYKDLLAESDLDVSFNIVELKRTKNDFHLGWQMSKDKLNSMKVLLDGLYYADRTLPETANTEPVVLPAKAKSLLVNVKEDTAEVKEFQQTIKQIQYYERANLNSRQKPVKLK